VEPKPLTEQELIDWDRWSRRDIKWEGRDVARLITTIRELQKRIAELEAGG
jgi:hypothetical protein